MTFDGTDDDHLGLGDLEEAVHRRSDDLGLVEEMPSNGSRSGSTIDRRSFCAR